MSSEDFLGYLGPRSGRVAILETGGMDGGPRWVDAQQASGVAGPKLADGGMKGLGERGGEGKRKRGGKELNQ